MSTDALQLELVTPSKVAQKLEATEVVLPGFLGELTVLPDHAPYVAQVRPGVVRIKTLDGESSFVLGSGFAEVADNKLLVLTRSVESRSDIDVGEAQRKLSDAQSHLSSLSMDDPTYGMAKEAVELYEAQVAFAS